MNIALHTPVPQGLDSMSLGRETLVARIISSQTHIILFSRPFQELEFLWLIVRRLYLLLAYLVVFVAPASLDLFAFLHKQTLTQLSTLSAKQQQTC